MPEKYILYLSTNNIWGGSEILWTESAKEFKKKDYKVKAALYYDYALIKQFIPEPEDYISLQSRLQRPSFFFRVLNKLKLGSFLPKDTLLENIKQQKPTLVIISQGNNLDGLAFMETCIALNIPFVTITQLVTEVHWPYINDAIIDQLNASYKLAKRNYFVSENSLQLHQKMMGTTLNNAEIIYNPFTKVIPPGISFPKNEDGVFKVALIGRIEMFHKGYDLLIDVLKQDKWKERPVHFSLYGKGPHTELLKRLIAVNKINNFSVHGHNENVGDIWQTNHLLLMPSRMEGQSLTLIEAMHFNRASIATDVGGTNEIVENGVNGFIADAATAEAIATALEKAWHKRAEWEQMGINAGKIIAHKHPADAIAFFNNKIEDLLHG